MCTLFYTKSTTEFVKIIAPPADAYKVPEDANGWSIFGTWYTADDSEIGPVIWGGFAIIQQMLDDPCGDWGGDFYYKSPDHAGFGGW